MHLVQLPEIRSFFLDSGPNSNLSYIDLKKKQNLTDFNGHYIYP